MQLGAVHYLVKPFGFAALSERLRGLPATTPAHRRVARSSRSNLTSTSCSESCAHPAVDQQAGEGPLGTDLGTRPRTPYAPRTVAVSAAEIAEDIGVSRATAQRYLNYLERHGLVRLQLRYGATGRPEHEYSPA